jgi:hypothetical protein
MNGIVNEVVKAWDAQAPILDQWHDLGADEMVEFACMYVLRKCADICTEVGIEGEGMAGEVWCHKCAAAISSISSRYDF